MLGEAVLISEHAQVYSVVCLLSIIHACHFLSDPGKIYDIVCVDIGLNNIFKDAQY